MQFVEANGARIPSIGLGTWELRGRTCARIVEQAVKLGYRHFDTAQIYENEREVGEGIRASGIKRDEMFVTTKVWTTHFAPNELERSAKESLVKLRMPYVDLLLLHWPNPHVPLPETLGALARVKQAGPGPPHRGVEFHGGADRGGGGRLPGAAGLRSGRVPSLSRPDQGEGGLRAASAWRWSPIARSPRAGSRTTATLARIGRALWQERGAGVPALAGAAECLRDPAHLTHRTAVGEHRYFRFFAR